MLERLVMELGPWNWMVLGFILLAIEILAPGFFLIWIGLAAIATGLLSLLFVDAAFWGWQIQMLVFAVFVLISVAVGRRIMRDRSSESDEPLLNLRAEQLVGRTATLAEPINNGQGRVKLDDTTWRISGPDLPEGSRIRIVAVQGGRLTVEAAG